MIFVHLGQVFRPCDVTAARRAVGAAFLGVFVALSGQAWASVLKRPPILAQQLDAGWWVIAASPAIPEGGNPADPGPVQAKAARCGHVLFNDLSSKFSGFTPGLEVFVSGAYRSRAAATSVAAELRPCFPTAYVKYGRYAGE